MKIKKPSSCCGGNEGIIQALQYMNSFNNGGGNNV